MLMYKGFQYIKMVQERFFADICCSVLGEWFFAGKRFEHFDVRFFFQHFHVGGEIAVGNAQQGFQLHKIV